MGSDRAMIERVARRAAEREAAFTSSRSLHLRDETAKALANRPDQMKASVLADVLKEVAQLSGVEAGKADQLAKHTAKDFLSRLHKLKVR